MPSSSRRFRDILSSRWLLLLIVIGFTVWVYLRRPVPPHTITFGAFHTTGMVTVWAPEKPACYQCLMSDLQMLHCICDLDDSQSELSRLNATAAEKPFSCSPLLWSMLQAARRGYAETEGAFDISAAPLIDLWQSHIQKGTTPTDQEIERTLAYTGLQKIQFDNAKHTVHFPARGFRLNLNGLQRGYACCLIQQVLQKNNHACFMIDLGGLLLFSEKAPRPRRAYTVDIPNPRQRAEILLHTKDCDCCYATGGTDSNAKKLQGNAIDPRTGRLIPCPGPQVIRLPLSYALEADYLANAFSIQPDLIKKLQVKYPFLKPESVK